MKVLRLQLWNVNCFFLKKGEGSDTFHFRIVSDDFRLLNICQVSWYGQSRFTSSQDYQTTCPTWTRSLSRYLMPPSYPPPHPAARTTRLPALPEPDHYLGILCSPPHPAARTTCQIWTRSLSMYLPPPPPTQQLGLLDYLPYLDLIIIQVSSPTTQQRGLSPPPPLQLGKKLLTSSLCSLKY